MLFDRIKVLKEKGICPDLIFDIGAHHGNWTKSMCSIFPNSRYLLFEAIDYPELTTLKSIQNINVFNVCLNETNKEIDWYEMKNTGDSMFKEKTCHFEGCAPIKKQSFALDSILQLPPDIHSVFIKIDCQGAELPILKGATKILEKTDFVLLELPFFGQYNEGVPSFSEHIQYMDQVGFIPYDILEWHYMHGFLVQIDFMFIKKTHPFTQAIQEKLVAK